MVGTDEISLTQAVADYCNESPNAEGEGPPDDIVLTQRDSPQDSRSAGYEAPNESDIDPNQLSQKTMKMR